MIAIEEVEAVDTVELQKVIDEAKSLARPEPAAGLSPAVASALDGFQRAMASLILLKSTEVMEAEQTLRSMIAMLEPHLSTDADLTGVIKAVEDLQASAKAAHDSVRTISAGSGDRLKWMARALSEASRRLFDLAEAVRWACLEAQADAELRQGKSKKFAGKEQALAHLDRLMKR